MLRLELLRVELEGIEPSSKRGTNVLSTCVVSDYLSGTDRPETANLFLSFLNFATATKQGSNYLRYSCTAISISLGKRTIGRCLVPATVAGIKPIYCASIRQRERSCFRHLKKFNVAG